MGDVLSTLVSQITDIEFYSANVSVVVCLVAMAGHFDGRPQTIARRALDVVLLLVMESLLSLVTSLIGGPIVSFAGHLVTIACYVAAQRELRRTDRLVRGATYFSAFVLLTAITGVLSPALNGLGGFLSLRLMPNLLTLLSLLVVALFLRNFAVSGFKSVPRSFALLIVATAAIGVAVVLVFIGFTDSHQFDSEKGIDELTAIVSEVSALSLIVEVALLALLLIAYYLFFMVSFEHEREEERIVRHRALEKSSETIEMTRTVYESVREMRHEMKNRMAYMESLCRAGDWDHLSRYISSFTEQASGILNYVQSGNGSVDAVINTKIALAGSRGVRVKTMLAIPPDLGYSEDDLFGLIGNLMDNAIDGALMSEAEDKVIRFSMRPEGGYYVISVQNPCSPRKDAEGPLTRLRTTKDDAEAHGYGTRVISHIARHNGGTARYRVTDNVFTTNVLLARKDVEQEGDA